MFVSDLLGLLKPRQYSLSCFFPPKHDQSAPEISEFHGHQMVECLEVTVGHWCHLKNKQQ